MKKYKAICFDFDYTLGDSTDSIVAGFENGFRKLGWPQPDRETVRGTVGFLLEDAYTMLTGDENAENRALFRQYFIEVAMERQRRETKLFPYAAELLRLLQASGVKAGIVSTKRGDTIEIIMENYALRDTLEVIIGSADVKKHKPDPQGLFLAMERLGVGAEEMLFCGDTVLDAGAAKNAGCDFAAVLNGTTPAQAFSEYPCVHIAPDLEELARWFGE